MARLLVEECIRDARDKNGKFLSYEITTAKRFEEMLRQHMG